MSDKPETVSNSNHDNETDTDTVSSTSVRLFGQFKPVAKMFSHAGQLTINDNSSSSMSYFTSALSKLSSSSSTTTTKNTSGFGSKSLAASLTPVSSNSQSFGGFTSTTFNNVTTKENGKNTEEDDDDDDDNQDGNDDDDNSKGNTGEGREEKSLTKPSLFETAAKYEAKRASTYPITIIQGDTSTGEEHELTKFQMTGKLYIFIPEQKQFIERGYGILKINESRDPTDWNKLHVRMIMRLDKAFRVILNSPILPKMTVERVGDRSVRFGAQDESQLRVFTIKASANDCINFYNELKSKIDYIERQHASSDSNPGKVTSNTPASSQNSRLFVRKRSQSKSDSETSDNRNSLSKKTKSTEAYRNPSQDDSNEDSSDSIKISVQETGP